MIVDIFYPIFTLMIPILECLLRKKQNCLVVLYPCLHQGIALGPMGPYSYPRPPAAIIFGFAENLCAHIFSVLSLKLKKLKTYKHYDKHKD